MPLGEQWFETIKGKGSKIRDEYEIQLLREQFNQLWRLCERLTIHKWRYDLPCKEGVLFIDNFKNELSGLWTLEVEFETLEDCDKFTPYEWFGKEVTEDFRYTNLQLAINGLPKENGRL
jgi:CYTH domain-containing protein